MQYDRACEGTRLKKYGSQWKKQTIGEGADKWECESGKDEVKE
jgi:hypothetical protein